ncbi:MAG: thioesterase family protein [Bacteroidales bacterium]|nr:thioesterase family protein [Bacteroidales bacterium]
MYVTPIQVRFNDIDMMGHINNAIVMEYLDLAKSRYFAAAGVPVKPEEGDFTVMVVRHEIDFLSQIHYHDDVEVHTCTECYGNKSIRLALEVYANGKLACRCATVMCGYLRSVGSSALIPEELKEQLRCFDAAHA